MTNELVQNTLVQAVHKGGAFSPLCATLCHSKTFHVTSRPLHLGSFRSRTPRFVESRACCFFMPLWDNCLFQSRSSPHCAAWWHSTSQVGHFMPLPTTWKWKPHLQARKGKIAEVLYNLPWLLGLSVLTTDIAPLGLVQDLRVLPGLCQRRFGDIWSMLAAGNPPHPAKWHHAFQPQPSYPTLSHLQGSNYCANGNEHLEFVSLPSQAILRPGQLWYPTTAKRVQGRIHMCANASDDLTA